MNLSCVDILARELAAPAVPLLGSEIHYQIYGESRPETLVLIHGLDSAGATFTPVIEALAQKYRVLVYDQRGHGQTPGRGLRYDSSLMAADLEALLNHLGLKKVHLLGHSMGARTAARFLEQHPERVESLIIEDMELLQRSRGDLAKATEQAHTLKDFPKQYSSREALVQALEPYYGEESASLSYRRARQNPDGSMTLLFNPDVSVLYGSQGNRDDFSMAWEHLRTKPVLVLRADPKFGSALSEQGVLQFQLALPAVKIDTIPGAKHNMHGTQTGEFLKRVTGFLDKVNKS